MDAYDLSTDLWDNNYCSNEKNSNAPPAAAARLDHSNILGYASSTGDEECHPKEGDSFMYESDDAGSENNNSASLGKPKAESSGGGGSNSSSANDDDGDSSLTSASGQCNLYDSADTSDEEHDSDTSRNGYEFYEEANFPTGVDDVVHVSLADLCHRIKAPLYAYNKILRWAQDANAQGYSFPINAPQYSTFISNLKKRLLVKDYVHHTITVKAAGGGMVSFPIFDFQSMFLSLIDDPRIKGNLLINWDDPSAPPPFDSGFRDEIHSGMWHEQTSAKLLTSNSNDILCGIILVFDHTHVADKDKLSLEPVLFSLSIIPRALHNHPFAWRPLGFIPKFSRSNSLGFKTLTYHRVLGRMLSSLVRAQKMEVLNAECYTHQMMLPNLNCASRSHWHL
jgi:hypothetical protein